MGLISSMVGRNLSDKSFDHPSLDAESGRLALDPTDTLAELRRSLDLREAPESFGSVVDAALRLTWARDPFDRLIAAQAITAGARLLTRDEHLLGHVPGAFWE